MKRMNLLLLIVSLLCVSSVYAGQTSFTIIDNVQNNIESTQEVNLGSFIIQQVVIPEVVTISNISNRQLEQQDIIIFVEPINITSPNGQHTILSTSQNYQLETIGTYVFRSIANPLQTASITVVKPNSITIDIEVEQEGFDVDVPVSITLNENQQEVEVLINPKDIETDEYEFVFDFTSPVKNKTIEKTINYKPVYSWYIENDITKNKNITTGNTTLLGTITIENQANTDLEYTIEVSSQIKDLLYAPNDGVVYFGGEKDVPIFSDVRLDTPSMTYNGSITFKSHNLTEEINISLTVIDSEHPEINFYNWSHSNVFEHNVFTLDAYDNVEIERATLRFNATTYNLTKNGKFWERTFNIPEPKLFTFTVCVYDSETEICEEFSKNFKRLDRIEVAEYINYKTKKINEYSSQFFINITDEIHEPIVFKVADIIIPNMTLGRNFKMRLVNEDGLIKQIDLPGKEYSITDKGSYEMEIFSEKQIDFDITIKFNEMKYNKQLLDMNIEGKFRDYEIQDNPTISWVDGEITCETNDRGTLEDSKIVCPFTFSADTELDNFVLPITKKEKEVLDNRLDDEKERYKSLVGYFSTTVTFIVVLLFGFIFYHLWYSSFRPYFLYLPKPRKGDIFKEED